MMYVARAYGIDAETGNIDTFPRHVAYRNSRKSLQKLRRSLQAKPGIKKVTTALCSPRHEELARAEFRMD